MNMPFTLQQFLDVFKQYNQSVFPMQLIFYVLGILVVFWVMRNTKNASIKINLVLSFCWLWMGVVYHLIYFTAINKAAFLFGTLFIIQGVLFYYTGIVAGKICYCFHSDAYGKTGAVLMLYALIIYPVWNYFTGHVYPAAPTFGLPCPTTIFTFGVLLCSDKRLPFFVLLIPLLWSFIGFFAAIQLGIVADFGLLAAGIIGFVMIIARNRKIKLSEALAYVAHSPLFLGIGMKELKERCSNVN